MDVPSNVLKASGNRITITTTSGSWVLWDAVRFEAPADVQLAAVEQQTIFCGITPQPMLMRHKGNLFQPVAVDILHVGQEKRVSLQFDDSPAQNVVLKPGRQTVEARLPPVETPTTVTLRMGADQQRRKDLGTGCRTARGDGPC